MHGRQCWWLQDPSTGWALRFQWIPEGSWHYRLEIIKGRAMDSQPALLAWRWRWRRVVSSMGQGQRQQQIITRMGDFLSTSRVSAAGAVRLPAAAAEAAWG